MSSYIDINTDELEEYVKIARRANEAISSVAELLNSIAVHNDWECTARNTIIDNTNRFRSDSIKLQADANNYYTAIIAASSKFIEKEQALTNRINDVDGIISSFLSKTSNSGGGGGHSFAGSTAKQSISKKSGGSSLFGNTVNFGDFASSLHTDGGKSLFTK